MAHKITLSGKDKKKGLRIPEEKSFDLAYLTGVLAGDGSLGHRPKKYEYSLKCVGNPKDEQEFYNKVIEPLFQKVFGINLEIKHFDKKATYGFRTHSKALVTYLTKEIGLPLGRKFDTLIIPKWVFLDEKLQLSFLRGLFDTDGSMVFKKRYRDYPYYPVISFSSKSKLFTEQVAQLLKNSGFKIVETYDYKILDSRTKKGFTIINKIELNGKKNFFQWIDKIGFSSPKNLKKIKKWGPKGPR